MWSRSCPWWSSVAVAALAAMVSGACGGGDGDAPGATSTAAAQPASASPRPPVELGKAIAASYFEMMDQAGRLLQTQPDAALLRPDIVALRDRYIVVFVAYGREREALGTAGRDAVDAELRTALLGAPAAIVVPLSEASARLQSTDPNLAKMIVSLNILTQYANFDLLKKQEPAEAERLAIK